MNPLIGVTGSAGRGYGMWLSAWAALKLQGCRPFRITSDRRPVEWSELDGLIIGGGDDIGAELYGMAPTPNVKVDPARDELELEALMHLWSTQKPILGTCRGSQIINVFRGGSLHQDINAIYEAAPRMRTVLPKKHVELDHGRLADILGVTQLRVNALHHQSVAKLGEGLRVAARDGAGIVQAVETASGPFRIGVQWHPEFLFLGPIHNRLFAAFADAARMAAARTVPETARLDAPQPNDQFA